MNVDGREPTECVFWSWDRHGTGWAWCPRQKDPDEVYCLFHERLKREGKF